MAFETKTILVDMDNVIAWFDQGISDGWHKKFSDRPTFERKNFYFEKDYPQSLRTEIKEVYSAPGFFANLPEVPGGIEAVKQIQALGHYVLICTSPLSSNPTCEQDKKEWVKNHLGNDWVPRVRVVNDKTLVFGDYLIDDKPNPSKGGDQRPSWEHIVYAWPYNGRDKTVLTWGKRRITWANWQSKLPELILQK